MADFAVSTSFRAKDKISKSFRDMDRGAARFGRTAKRSFRDASRSASRFRDITKGILAAGVVQRGVGLLTQGLRSLTEQFIDFDQATIGAAARFKDIGPDAVDFERQLKKIRDRAREAGATTEFTAAQSAAALDFLARAGFKSATAFGSLDSMINLATASGEDFATVANFSSDLLGSFGMNVRDVNQKIANLNRLNDVLVKTANSANVTIEDMFETMKIAAPVATAMGQSLEEISAITGFLGGAGIKGSQGATALKNAILKLTAPSSLAIKMIKGLGIQVDDGTGNMRSLNMILGDLAPELKKMGNLKAGKILNEIFGKRAIAGAINIANGTEAIIELQKALENAEGTAQKTADRMRKSLGNRLKALGSATTELGFKIIEAFEVRGENAIDVLTKAVRDFDPAPIIEGLNIAVDIIGGLWRVLKPFMPFLPWFLGMWVAFGTIMRILAIAKMASSFLLFWGAITKTAGAMGVLNAVMVANPVGAIILGVTALIALLVLVVKNWDKIKEAFATFKLDFLAGLQIIDKAIGALFEPWLEGLDIIRGFFGFGPEAQAAAAGGTTAAPPPNQQEALARRDIGFEGRLTIAGAPAGSTVEGRTTGAPDIEMELLGGA
jgi:TP901 family phage tail tape measure protein